MAEFNTGTLVLKLRDGRNKPLKDIVDIEVEHHTLTKRVVLRDVDTRETGGEAEVRNPNLPAGPQGLHRVYVDPDHHKSEAEFVNIEPDTETAIEMRFKKEGRGPVVELDVDRIGNFTIAPTTRVARNGDKISWKNRRGPFVIHFNDRSPFRDATLQSEPDDKGVHHVSARIQRDTDVGVFEYASAIYSVAEGKVFIHVSGEIKIMRGF